MKKLVSALLIFSVIFITSVSPPVKAVSAMQGFAVYRDGVGAIGINLDWHTAIMAGTSTASSSAVIHAPGPNNVIKYGSWSEFMGSDNVFKGYYKPKYSMTTMQRDNVC